MPKTTDPIAAFVIAYQATHKCGPPREDARKGDKVRYWFDTGATGYQMLFGVVVAAGSKAFTVEWESGVRNRIRQNERRDVTRVTEAEYVECVRRPNGR